MEAARKRILCLYRHPPYGGFGAQEGLEVVLIGAAFDQEVSVAFLDDGVELLRPGQAPEGIGRKPFTRGLGALELYEVAGVYAELESLRARGLEPDRLALPVTVLSREEMARLLERHDAVLTF